MTEKTKNIISYAYRSLFGMTVLISMLFGDKLKDVTFVIIPIVFISAGIVGFVTNRNYRMYPTLPTPKGNILCIIENTIAILLGIGILIFYIGFIKR
jgi:hypothetical protein